MILKDKSSDKNKVASIVYYSSAVIIVASNILESFFGLVFKNLMYLPEKGENKWKICGEL